MKLIFKTKFVKDMNRNGQECEIIYTYPKREGDLLRRIDIKFKDGYIIKMAYMSEVEMV